MSPINIEEKFAAIKEYLHPYLIGELNENYLKLAKVKDEFAWHKHDHEDELFIIYKGTLIMDFRDKTVEVKAGEILLVPKGVEHRPRTNGEDVHIMLVEPKQTKHTGELVMEKTVTQLDWL